MWLLASLFGDDVGAQLKQSGHTSQWEYTGPGRGPGMRPNRHDANRRRGPLSTFAWNIRIRALIHILGDLHQPLHAAEMFTTRFPHGDAGGTHVRVVVPGVPQVRDLHQVWDTCGGLLNASWPDVSESDALSTAQQLTHKFPPDSVPVTSATTFAAVANESYELVQSVVYREFLESRGTGTIRQGPYRPSPQYMREVQHVCRLQIALAGYRLARVLEDLSIILRLEKSVRGLTERHASHLLPMLLTASPAVVCVLLLCLICSPYRRNWRSNEEPLLKSAVV